MYNYMDSVGIFSSLYFPLVVLLGSFFLLNLFLAVIMETFSEMTEIQKQLEQAKKEAKNRRMRKILAKNSSQENLDGTGVQRQETNKNKMIQRMISVNERKNELTGGKIMNFADIAILMLAHKQQIKMREESNKTAEQPLINIDDITEDSDGGEEGQGPDDKAEEKSDDPSADAQRSSDQNQPPSV